MSVNIDTVYQKVLMIANKEQRGYITPQEFNLFADHAQKEIFEQYFYDLKQFKGGGGDAGEYSDIIDNIQEKIMLFEREGTVSPISSNPKTIQASDLYRLGSIKAMGPTPTEIEEVQENELLYINQSPLTKPTKSRPVYTRHQLKKINTYPVYIGPVAIKCNYVRYPSKPRWGYFVVGNKALYDSSSNKTSNFMLHASEESELVYKILKLAGITLKNPEIVQVSQALEQGQVQQEKQ